MNSPPLEAEKPMSRFSWKYSRTGFVEIPLSSESRRFCHRKEGNISSELWFTEEPSCCDFSTEKEKDAWRQRHRHIHTHTQHTHTQHTQAHAHPPAHTHTHTHPRARTRTRTRTRTQARTHARMHARTTTRVHAHTYTLVQGCWNSTQVFWCCLTLPWPARMRIVGCAPPNTGDISELGARPPGSLLRPYC